MGLTKIKETGIADDAVTAGKIAAGAVVADITTGSVTATHLAGSIPLSKTNLTAGNGISLATDTVSVSSTLGHVTGVGTLTSLTTSGVVGVTVANVSGVTASTDADDLVIENTAHNGISILTNDNQTSNLYFGQASSNRTARVDYAGDTNIMHVGTTKASGQLQLQSANGTTGITLDASSNTTFAGTVTAPSFTANSGTPALLMTETDTNPDSECRIVNGGGNLYIDGDLNDEIADSFMAFRLDNGTEKMRIANALTTFTTDLKISDDLYFNGGGNDAWIIGKTNGSGTLRIQKFAQFKVDGNISTKESLSIGADSWVGHAQIQLWDDRKEETSMPLVSEIAFYESNMADSATAVLEVEAGYVYTNGFVDVRINGESGNGTQTHYYGTHSFGFHPSGCSFGDVGTPVESASDTVSFAYQSSAKFRISVKCQADDTRLAFYFKVYGFGADQGGNTYNGCTITRLID